MGALRELPGVHPYDPGTQWAAMSPTGEPPLDYAMLAEALTALAYPVRLELLDTLRFPKTLSEIEVEAPAGYGGASPRRPLSTSTIRGHLEQLVEEGLVRVQTVEKGGREVPRYAVVPARLYGLTEELRRLSVHYAGRGAREEATGTVQRAVEGDEMEGPRLVLAHGVYEGKAFPLDDDTAQDGRWTIGRDPELPVCLDYDPFVSGENSVVEPTDDGFQVRDLGSKNGTRVNWRLLGPDEHRELRAGDLVGVGRSLLVYVRE